MRSAIICHEGRAARTSHLRFDRAPLLRIAQVRSGLPRCERGAKSTCPLCVLFGCYSVARLAEDVGVSRETVSRWGTNGLTAPAADAAACRLGLPVTAIWPDYYDRHPELDDDEVDA